MGHDLAIQARHHILNGFSPATLSTYLTAWNAFKRFHTTTGVPFPSNHLSVIAAFVTYAHSHLHLRTSTRSMTSPSKPDITSSTDSHPPLSQPTSQPGMPSSASIPLPASPFPPTISPSSQPSSPTPIPTFIYAPPPYKST